MKNYSLDVIKNFIVYGIDNFFRNRYILGKYKMYYSIEDLDTNMISLHHFPLNENINQYYIFFLKIMKIRYQNLIHVIANSNLLCFISNGRDQDELEKFKMFIDDKFYQNCFIVNVVNSEKEYIVFDWIKEYIPFILIIHLLIKNMFGLVI